MSDCCVLYRRWDGKVHAILELEGTIKVWPDRDAALAEIEKVPLSSPWQLVELGEL